MSATYSAGVVTAYGAAVRSGYTGTYEEFCQAMADLAMTEEQLAHMQVNVIMLDPSAQPSATYVDGVLTMRIPRGERGETGPRGERGEIGPQGVQGPAGEITATSLAPRFDAAAPYYAGQPVVYDGQLYRFTADHSAGPWNGTDAEEAKIAEDVSELKSAVDEISEPYGINIFNPYTLLRNKYIGVNESNMGQVVDNENYDLTGFIDVSDTDRFTFKIFGYTGSPAFYVYYYYDDEATATAFDRRIGNTNYVPTGRTMRLDTDVKYIRIAIDHSDSGTINPISVVVVKGEQTISEYIPYLTAFDKKARETFSTLNSKYIFKTLAPGYSSCDDITDTCWMFVSSSGGVLQIPDAPMIGWLQTYYVNANVVFQIMYPWNPANNIQFREKYQGTWSQWSAINYSGTTTITEEVNRDTYNNTYNITTNPTITTDTNGWLQAVDTDTEDETGKTDMTGAIMSMLTSTGYCHLGPGIFYVSGNIDMPANSILEGCGNKTIIRLLQSVESGYIIRPHTYSIIKNIRFSGSRSAFSIEKISSGNVGGRKGIAYIGNANGQGEPITPASTSCCLIEGCKFEFLDSAFYGNNSGGGLHNGVIFNDCYIYRCMVGINIDYKTEYCKFTNVITFQCWTACINAGGNNVFTSCTFHGVIGFVIDNSGDDKANIAHGTVNGCIFNHIDNLSGGLGNGYAIKVIQAANGFIFSNCQIWYGKIYIENSPGVQFIGCTIGGGNDVNYKIETSGSYNVFFNDCLFEDAPSMSLLSPTKWERCFTYGGSTVGV